MEMKDFFTELDFEFACQTPVIYMARATGSVKLVQAQQNMFECVYYTTKEHI